MQRSNLRWVLVAIEAVIGVFAIQAGYSMITGAWDLPMEWLQHTPFTSWVLPGIALMVFVGVGELVAAGALAFRLPRAAELSVAAGVGLVAWILVQLLWMRVVHPVMHPVIGGAGLLIALLALRLRRSATRPADDPPRHTTRASVR